MIHSTAIVSYPHEEGSPFDWRYETVTVREELKENEVLVKVSSVGLCHTDILLANKQVEGPLKIFGHEGVGEVQKVGSGVINCREGDKVVLSFDFCKTCNSCTHNSEAYCTNAISLNIGSVDNDKTYRTVDGIVALGKFFGQSTFSNYAVVSDSCIVNLNGLGVPDDKLDYLGPLGCGFQTGAAGIIKAAGAQAGESCVVYGLGGVGLAALMAAKVAGCSPIIAVDLLDTKLEQAKTVGATHTIKGGNDEDVHRKILEITGHGANISFECIGGAKFVQEAIRNAAIRGRIVYAGIDKPEAVIQIPSFSFMSSGKTLIGVLEGSATPSDFVPKMIDWFLSGKFPIDKIEKQYSVKDFQTALADIKSGKTVKAILKF